MWAVILFGLIQTVAGGQYAAIGMPLNNYASQVADADYSRSTGVFSNTDNIVGTGNTGTNVRFAMVYDPVPAGMYQLEAVRTYPKNTNNQACAVVGSPNLSGATTYWVGAFTHSTLADGGTATLLRQQQMDVYDCTQNQWNLNTLTPPMDVNPGEYLGFYSTYSTRYNIALSKENGGDAGVGATGPTGICWTNSKLDWTVGGSHVITNCDTKRVGLQFLLTPGGSAAPSVSTKAPTPQPTNAPTKAPTLGQFSYIGNKYCADYSDGVNFKQYSKYSKDVGWNAAGTAGDTDECGAKCAEYSNTECRGFHFFGSTCYLNVDAGTTLNPAPAGWSYDGSGSGSGPITNYAFTAGGSSNNCWAHNDIGTDSPTVSSKAPTVSSKAPTVSSKAPTVSTKAPTVSSKAPTVSTKAPTQAPTVSSKAPTITTKAPTAAPTVSSKAPTVSSKAPTVTSKAPTVSSMAPTVVPTVSSKAPTVSSKAPTASTKAPTASTKAPTLAPTLTSKAPTVTTKAPTVSTKAPTITSKAPTVATKAPTVSTKAPTTTSKAPTASSKAPTVTTKAPTISSKAPTAASRAPTVTSKSPTAAPTGATKAPTSATKAPTTKQPTSSPTVTIVLANTELVYASSLTAAEAETVANQYCKLVASDAVMYSSRVSCTVVLRNTEAVGLVYSVEAAVIPNTNPDDQTFASQDRLNQTVATLSERLHVILVAEGVAPKCVLDTAQGPSGSLRLTACNTWAPTTMAPTTPTKAPTVPTAEPTAAPIATRAPSRTPTSQSPTTAEPTTVSPTVRPTETPTKTATESPVSAPTATTSSSDEPSGEVVEVVEPEPEETPVVAGSALPTASPNTQNPTTAMPTDTPTSRGPTKNCATFAPTVAPTTAEPTPQPTPEPSLAPTMEPTVVTLVEEKVPKKVLMVELPLNEAVVADMTPAKRKMKLNEVEANTAVMLDIAEECVEASLSGTTTMTIAVSMDSESCETLEAASLAKVMSQALETKELATDLLSSDAAAKLKLQGYVRCKDDPSLVVEDVAGACDEKGGVFEYVEDPRMREEEEEEAAEEAREAEERGKMVGGEQGAEAGLGASTAPVGAGTWYMYLPLVLLPVVAIAVFCWWKKKSAEIKRANKHKSTEEDRSIPSVNSRSATPIKGVRDPVRLSHVQPNVTTPISKVTTPMSKSLTRPSNAGQPLIID